MLAQSIPNATPWLFSTKASTLSFLTKYIESAQICTTEILTYAVFKSWQLSDSQALFNKLNAERLIVRSSYSQEDSAHSSMAGMFTTCSDITSATLLYSAIEQVFASYPSQFSPDEYVLIQAQISNLSHCGVIFTTEQDSGGPYTVIADDTSGANDAVTSGNSNSINTYYIAHNCPKKVPTFIERLLNLTHELTQGFAQAHLDIEYGIDTDGTVWLFQVRPLLTSTEAPDNTKDKLANIATKLAAMMQPHPFLHGKKTVFGIMPDWNPAEIIGLKPKPLALSLYKNLITNNIWAYQRHNYGYRNLRSFPLLVDFEGLPYIDVRVSFNSFLPKEVTSSLGDKLVDYYLEKLQSNPHNHDSVEFDIVMSCYTFSLQSKMQGLENAGFTATECAELSAHLKSLTNRIIDPRAGLWIQDLHKIEKLKERFAVCTSGFPDPLERAYWLLEDCKRYGTLPFAGLARAAFIAVQLLQSLVEEGIITESQSECFLATLNTVSSELQTDFRRLPKTDFLHKYGHLRPGTYEITSPRYDAMPDQYFTWPKSYNKSSDSKQADPTTYHSTDSLIFGAFDQATFAAINQVLDKHGIQHSGHSFLHFLKSAIEGREYAKFIFTRNLSAAMEALAEFGQNQGFSREDMSFCNADIIQDLITSSQNVKQIIAKSICEGRARYEYTSSLKLPPLICEPEDIYCFKLDTAQATFITQKSITGQVVSYQETKNLVDNIVFISSADPGFDWIFSHNIKGFVTAFGGCNSHMAIRAAELGIPAIIGAGEENFQNWQKAQTLNIDCAAETVRSLK